MTTAPRVPEEIWYRWGGDEDGIKTGDEGLI